MALFKKLTDEEKKAKEDKKRRRLGYYRCRLGIRTLPGDVVFIKYNPLTDRRWVVDGRIVGSLFPWIKSVAIDGKEVPYDLPVTEIEVRANKGDRLDQAGININIDVDLSYRIIGDVTYKQYVKHEYEKAIRKKRINTKNIIEKLLSEEERRKKIAAIENDSSILDKDAKKREEGLDEPIYISNISMNTLKAGIYDCLNEDNPFRDKFIVDYNMKTIKKNGKEIDVEVDVNQTGTLIGENILSNHEFMSNIKAVVKSLKDPILRYCDRKDKIKELKQWQEEHGAIKKYNDWHNNNTDVKDKVNSIVIDTLRRYCRKKTYTEVQDMVIGNELDFIIDVNNQLKALGVELSTIIFKKVEQSDKALSQAYEKKAIAEQELEAAKFRAEAKKVEEKAKIEAIVETLKDNGMYDPSIVAAALNPNMHLVNLGGGLKGISIQTDAMQREQTIQPVVTTVGQDTQTVPAAQQVQNTQTVPAAEPVQNTQTVPAAEPVQNTQSAPAAQQVQNTQTAPAAEPVQNTQTATSQGGLLTQEEINALLGNREGKTVIAPEQTIETEFDLDSREPVVVSQQEMAEQMGARETQSQSDFINSLNALSSEPEVQNRDENNYKARFVPQDVFVDEAVSQNMDAEMNAAKANFNEVADRTIENAKNNDNIGTVSSSDERKAELEALKEELEKNYTDDEYADLIMNGFFDEDEKNKGY